MGEANLSKLEIFPGSTLTQEGGGGGGLVQKMCEVVADPKEVIKFYVDQIQKLTGKSEEEIKSTAAAVNAMGDEGQYSLGADNIMIQIGTEKVNGRTAYVLTEKTTA